MKYIITLILMISSLSAYSQQWVQTSSTPDGAGITDMIVTEQGTLIVTTASWDTSQGHRGGIRRSTNEGQSWQNVFEAYNGRTLYQSNGVLYASAWNFPSDNESIYRSTDDGVTWTPIHFVLPLDNIFSIAATRDNQTIFIGTRKGVKRSTTSGVSWLYTNAGMPVNSWIRDIEIDTANGIVLAATTNGVYTSTDNGESWNQATGINPGDTVVSVSIDYPINSRGDDAIAYWGSKKGNIYYSGRNTQYLGLVFNTLLSDGEVNRVLIGILDGKFKIYGASVYPNSGGMGGFFMSENGNSYFGHNLGLPLNPSPSTLAGMNALKRSGENGLDMFLGTFENNSSGAKVYKITYVIGIEQISSTIPASFSLNQNYPNPFNPSTKINFSITKKDFVSLKIFNSQGKEVADLVNNVLAPGTYSFEFNAASLASGVYFYKLRSGDFSDTKKMLYIK